MTITFEPLPFEEAQEYFDELLALTPDEYYALEQAARVKAFTVADIAVRDLIEDIHGAITTAIADGETLADFRDRLDDIFQSRGWDTPPEFIPWRVETIFRTNIQTAYQAGRYKQMKDQQDRFPYWEYDAVMDSRTRPTHAAMDGKIFRADHPFWDTWYPPNGFNCRCTVHAVHKHLVEEEDLAIETHDPTGELIEPVEPVTGKRIPARQLLPDPGWDHKPID
jgi:SPP1 gp7 family putative phage head morphogenesis protein